MAFLKAWKEKEKKENLAEIARLEQNLENLRVSLSDSKYEFDTDYNFEEIWNSELPLLRNQSIKLYLGNQ